MTGPPVPEMRGSSISIGTSAASEAPSPIARRSRNAFSLPSPTRTTSTITSLRPLAIGADSTCRAPNGIACVVQVCPCESESDNSFTGTARNITSCIAARSSLPQTRTPRAASSSSASTARASRISVSAMTRRAEMASSPTPCCAM